MILTFTDYLSESERSLDVTASGLAIIYQGSILLVHPANASWQRQPFGIPKGGIEPGESYLECAIREVKEETGITVDPELVNPTEKFFVFYRGGTPHSRCAYFEVWLEDLSQIGLESTKVPKDQLQEIEVDWAGFVPIGEALTKLSRSQQIIAQRLLETLL
jgi:8-oxo-dGTP pyrophosphatase MutT (NUDIX family)